MPNYRRRSWLGTLGIGAIVAWFVGGIGLYFYDRGWPISSWKDVFMLKEQPVLSVALLLVLAAAIWMHKHKHWHRIGANVRLVLLRSYKWLFGFLSSRFHNVAASYRGLGLLPKRVLWVSFGVYIGLFLIALSFPGLTGYAFKTDWAVLLAAAVPLITLVILLLFERVQSFKAKFAGVEVEFEQAVTSPATESVMVDSQMIQKGMVRDLPSVLERAQREQPSILLVPLGNGIRIGFLALRQYIHQLALVAPIRYIVFVTGEDHRYQGFVLAERFARKYPLDPLEALLQAETQRTNAHEWVYPWFRFKGDPWEALRQFQREVVLPQWTADRPQESDADDHAVTRNNISRLGATRYKVRPGALVEGYKIMLDNDLPGVPVVDERGKFVGVVEREKVLAEVIRRLLSKKEP